MRIDTQDEALERIRDLDAAAERHETNAPGGAMVWREWGAGPPLVLLHGGSGSWMHWIHCIPHFMHAYRVLAADLPGLGDSPSPAEPYHARSLAEVVCAGLDALIPASQRYDMAGFSFGGILGGELTLLCPQRIRSFVVVGSPAFAMPSTGPTNDVLAVAPDLPFEQAESLHRRNLSTLMLADTDVIDALALRIHHENLRRARLRSRKIARKPVLSEALMHAECTLHGIWGERDVTVHPDMASLERLIVERRTGNRFHVIEGAGHWVMFEAPDRFNNLLAEVLAHND